MALRGKYVITADVHVHPFKVCSRDNGADRMRDGLDALRQTLSIAAARGATWIMAGDFKQPKTNWPQEALTGAHEILREYRMVDKIMIAGNHDAMGLGGSGLAPFKDAATVIEGEAEEVGGVLYVPHGADLKPVKSNKHLPMVAHAFLRGAFIGPEDMRLPATGVDLAEYGQPPVAFFGDIHKAQYRTPSDPSTGRIAAWHPIVGYGINRTAGPWRGEVFYPGSPYQQNWGERNDLKGVLFVDLESGRVDFLPIIAPQFIHEELAGEALPGRLFRASREDFVRIVTDSAKRTTEMIESRGLTFRSLQIIERPKKTRVEKRTEIHAGMSKREIIASYIAAKPIPAGVTVEQVALAMTRLWGVQ